MPVAPKKPCQGAGCRKYAERSSRYCSKHSDLNPKNYGWDSGKIPKPNIPVVVVCGPAGSGKSTYCKEHMRPNDILIDLDLIMQDLSGLSRLEIDSSDWFVPALQRRQELLESLEYEHDKTAYFIVSAPTRTEREGWAKVLNASVVLLDVEPSICISRISADDTRGEVDKAGSIEAVIKFYSNFSN